MFSELQTDAMLKSIIKKKHIIPQFFPLRAFVFIKRPAQLEIYFKNEFESDKIRSLAPLPQVSIIHQTDLLCLIY